MPIATRPNARCVRWSRSSADTRPASPSGSARWTCRWPRRSRSRSSATRTTLPTDALLAEVRTGFRPNQVVACAVDPAASAVPLLHDRLALDGRPTAYVCRGFVCRLPVTDPAALRAELDVTAASATPTPSTADAG